MVLETRYGPIEVPGSEDLISKFLDSCGEWAWLETLFVASVLPPNARVLDIGSYLGTFGLGLQQASRNVDFTCFVEGNPNIAKLLERNVAACGSPESAVVGALAVGHRGNRVGIPQDENVGGMSFVNDLEFTDVAGANDAVRPTDYVTLSELRSRFGPFDLVKLDVEGMEQELLEADQDYFATSDCAIWVECREESEALQLAELLLSWNGDLYYFAFPAHNNANFLGQTTQIFPMAFEAGFLLRPNTEPQLDAILQQNECLLRRIVSVEDARCALWHTPRWGPRDWIQASRSEVVGVASHLLQGVSYADFLTKSGNTMDAYEPELAALSTDKSILQKLKMTKIRVEELQHRIAYLEASLAKAEGRHLNDIANVGRELDSARAEVRALKARLQKADSWAVGVSNSTGWRFLTRFYALLGKTLKPYRPTDAA